MFEKCNCKRGVFTYLSIYRISCLRHTWGVSLLQCIKPKTNCETELFNCERKLTVSLSVEAKLLLLNFENVGPVKLTSQSRTITLVN